MSSTGLSTTKIDRKRIALWALGAIAVLLALSALWLMLLPGKLATSLADALEDDTGLGVAVTGPSSISANGNGFDIRFAKVRMASPSASGGLLIDIDELTMPLKSSVMLGAMTTLGSARANGAMINLDVSQPLNSDSAGGKTDASATAEPVVHAFRLSFENSAVNLFDSKSSFKLNIADVTGIIERSAANEVLLHMTGMLNGVYTTLHMEADDATRLFAEGSPADIVLSSDSGELRFSGRTGWEPALAMDGRVFAASRRARDILGWLGLPAALAPEAAVEVEGALSTKGPEAKLPSFNWRVGSNGGTGTLRLSPATEGLGIDGTLDAPALAYAPHWSRATTGDDWSSQAYRWLPLPPLSGKLSVSTRSLSVDDWRLTGAVAEFKFDDTGANLHLTADDGKVAVDASASRSTPPDFRLKAKLDEAPARQSLRAIAGHGWLDGKLTLDLDLNAQGNDAAATVSSLKGSTALSVKEGKIDGYSLKDLLASGGKGWRSAQADVTEGLNAAFSGQVNDGILALGKSRIKAKDLDFSASGEVDLLRRALDLKATPGAAKGATAATAISGSWLDPEFTAVTAQSGQPATNQPSAN